MVPLSVLDLSPIIEGGDAGQSLRNSLDLARHVEARRRPDDGVAVPALLLPVAVGLLVGEVDVLLYCHRHAVEGSRYSSLGQGLVCLLSRPECFLV